MFRTIQRRIAIPYVVLILAAMLGMGVYLSINLKRDYQDSLYQTMAANTRLVAEMLTQPLTRGDLASDIDQQIERWSNTLDTRITVISAGGVVMLDSHENPATMDNHLQRPEVQAAILDGEGEATRFSVTLGTESIYKAVRVLDGERLVGVVRLSIPLSRVNDSIRRVQDTLITTTILVAFLVILLAIYISTSTTRPIREITSAVSKLANKDVSSGIEIIQSAPIDPIEITTLANAYNQMAGRLNQQITALQAEQNKNLAVLQAMTDGVIIVDSMGLVQMINLSAQKIFLMDENQAHARSFVEVIRHHQVYDLWRKTIETGKTQSESLEMAANKLYLQVIVAPLDQYQPGSSLMLFQNLTRQRFLETVRRDFISNISHELRTPLASLKAIAETLQSGALEDPPAARRFLQRMETEVDALTQMVTELLELARIESGRVPLNTRPVHPQDVLIPAVDRLRLQAERALLTLHIDCPDELPLIQADPVRLQQVIVNLLHNAIKYTNPGGNISILVKVDPQSTADTPDLVFAVIDTGVGINSGDLPRIFERFYKVDRARSSGGTGLGLAISRHLVEAHHGKIWAESIEGRGSTFYFSIPQAIPQISH